MNDFVIRSATVNDASGIAFVHVRTWQFAYRGQIPDAFLDSLSLEKRSENWTKQIEKHEDGVHIFVAEHEGKIAGWCSGGKSRDDDGSSERGELYGIYVDPDFIGKGGGALLMKRMLDALRADGYTFATLWVLDSNAKGRKFYEREGWNVEGKTKVDVRDTFELHELRYIISL